MTTPAISENRVTGTNMLIKVHVVKASSDYWENVWSANHTEEYLRMRPASSTSPLRPDGTRAPKGWAHHWAVVEVESRTEVVFKFRTGATEVRYYHNPPRPWLRASGWAASEIVSTGGIPWCFGNGSFPSNPESKAVTRLRKKILDGKAEWGATLGEMRETIRGVDSLGRRLVSFTGDAVRLVRNAKKMRKSDALDLVISLLNRGKRIRVSGTGRARKRLDSAQRQILADWLEFQFSVRPIVLDIQQSAAALDWLLNQEHRPLRLTFKAGGTDKHDTDVSYSVRCRNDVDAKMHARVTAMASCHFSVVCDITPTSDRTLEQLGLANSPAVLWELTPWSWMADYVIGIGDWLQSMVKLDGCEFVEGSKSYIARVKGTGTRGELRPANDTVVSITPNRLPYNIDIGRFERVVLGSIPGPAAFPPVRSRLGLTQLANTLSAVALLLAGRSTH